MNRTLCRNAIFSLTACLLAACSGAPETESTRTSVAALDPNQVFAPTSYTVTLSSIQVLQANEPYDSNVTCYSADDCLKCNGPNNCTYNPVPVQRTPPQSCDANVNWLWTPDTGYVDWAQIGFKVSSTVPGTVPFNDGNPGTNACSLGPAPTGAKLQSCKGGAYINGVFNEGSQGLSVNFTVNPGDAVDLALAVDNIESVSISDVVATKSNLVTDVKNTGDELQLAGAVVSVAGSLTGGSAVVSAIGGLVGMLGNGASVLGDYLAVGGDNACTASSLAYAATSCAGGLMGLSSTWAQSNTCGFNSTPYDALRIVDPSTQKPLTAERLQEITALGPATFEFTPSIDMVSPSGPRGCFVPRGATNPQQMIGCESSLKIDVTIARDWNTGLAASAKSADMAVVRSPGTIDTFNVERLTPNLLVHRYGQGTSFTPETEGSASLPVQKAGVTPSTTPVVVSRSPNNVDAFWVDSRGAMNTVFQAGPSFTWYTKNIFTPPLQVGRITIPALLPGNASMSAVARSPVNLDVFAIGTDGNVYTSAWNASSGVDSQGLPTWTAPVAITTGNCVNTNVPCAGSGAPGGAIASVARNDSQIDIFYIGKDGGVWTSFWNPQTPWTTEEIYGPSVHNQPNTAPATAGAGIAATARTSTNLDVLFVGTHGDLWTSAWSGGGNWGTWAIPGTAGVGLPGTSISAVSRNPAALDAVFEGPGGNLQWAYWSPQTSWNVASVTTGVGTQRGNVALVAPTSFSLQAFYLNGNYQLTTATWSEPACNPLLVQGCSERPNDFKWSSSTTLLTVL